MYNATCEMPTPSEAEANKFPLALIIPFTSKVTSEDPVICSVLVPIGLFKATLSAVVTVPQLNLLPV